MFTWLSLACPRDNPDCEVEHVWYSFIDLFCKEELDLGGISLALEFRPLDIEETQDFIMRSSIMDILTDDLTLAKR